MRRLAITLGMTLLATAAAGSALAQSTPADVRDLVGARASSGEGVLASRGYVNVGGQAGDDRKWTYWWNERRATCLSVTTLNGRYDAIVSTPAPDCRRRPSPSTLPGPVGGPVSDSRAEDIRFERGASSATRRGVIRGYETVTYRLDVRAGQMINVSMQGNNRSGYFNVTPPRANQAVFNGSTSGNRWRGRAATSGPYEIQVYLMRNAARRGEQLRYTLDVGVTR
ncbi:hypothetical protein [Caulobacter endophyticus]|uniref:hypothetical protein n=1 Tax=Caulobacter endophyticus TaxID=2172652 RepID=UPI00240F90DC|nr:hypothetical protein [Caulobacter endophyticus]MDG2528211.1 hypothetical protein [Caulobacter endophyticus]